MVDITALIIAISGLISAIGGVIGFFVAKFHLSPKIAQVASDLEDVHQEVHNHIDNISTAVDAIKALSPEAAKALDAHAAQIAVLTKEITDKTAALEKLKSALPQ